MLRCQSWTMTHIIQNAAVQFGLVGSSSLTTTSRLISESLDSSLAAGPSRRRCWCGSAYTRWSRHATWLTSVFRLFLRRGASTAAFCNRSVQLLLLFLNRPAQLRCRWTTNVDRLSLHHSVHQNCCYAYASNSYRWYDTIRYDAIEEFNMNSKAECVQTCPVRSSRNLPPTVFSILNHRPVPSFVTVSAIPAPSRPIEWWPDILLTYLLTYDTIRYDRRV